LNGVGVAPGSVVECFDVVVSIVSDVVVEDVSGTVVVSSVVVVVVLDEEVVVVSGIVSVV
jgi:hypothetical protein